MVSGIRHHQNVRQESADFVFQLGRLELPGRAVASLRSHRSALNERNDDQKDVTLVLPGIPCSELSENSSGRTTMSKDDQQPSQIGEHLVLKRFLSTTKFSREEI
jgi:hypothetical protein